MKIDPTTVTGRCRWRPARALLACLVLLAPLAPAVAAPWVADLSHTRVTFDVEHLGFSTMPGIFREVAVDLDFDPEAPERTRFTAVIDTASVDMFHEGLNEHLRNEDFFDSAAHPQITFTSTRVEPIGPEQARVTGDMTLLGRTRPVTFLVTLRKLAPSPLTSRLTVGFSAVGTLDRTAFGMDFAAPMVGTQIAFTIAAEFSPREETHASGGGADE